MTHRHYFPFIGELILLAVVGAVCLVLIGFAHSPQTVAQANQLFGGTPCISPATCSCALPK